MGWRKRSKYERKKYTLPSKVEVGDAELFWHSPYEYVEGPDETFIEKIVEWIQNFKVNFETIGFDRTVSDLPRIKGSALVVDHPFTGTLDRHLEELKRYDGTVLVTDRALWKVLPYKVPDIVANIDSSYLCISFIDRPDVKKYMKKINAVFAATTHPLTIRAWTSKTRYFFMPWLGSSYLTYNLAALGGLDVMYTGGEVSTLIWLLACLPPDELIIGNASVKMISEVAVNDKVLTHKGTFERVKTLTTRPYKGEIIEIDPWLFPKVRITPEHPVLVIKPKTCTPKSRRICRPDCPESIRRSNCCKKLYYKNYKPQWIPAKELRKNDILLYPKIKETKDIHVLDLYEFNKDRTICEQKYIFSKYARGKCRKRLTVIQSELGREEIIKKVKELKEAGLGWRRIAKKLNIRGTLVQSLINQIEKKMFFGAVKRFIKVDKDFMRLCGYYAAEGCCFPSREPDRVIFSFNSNEENYVKEVARIIERKFGVKPKIYNSKQTTTHVAIYCKSIARMFSKLFGSNAKEKKIPPWLLSLPKEKQIEFLYAIFRGDGDVQKRSRTIGYVTYSRELAFALRDILVRQNVVPSLEIKGKRHTLRIHGTQAVKLNNKIKFATLQKIRRRGFSKAWTDENYVYLPIKKVRNLVYDGVVHNLHVEGENTFVTSSFIVHNCNLGAKHIGMLAIDNCFHSIEETEYLGVPHEIWEVNPWSGEKLPRKAYVDPVYKRYAEVHHALIKYAKEKYGIETFNCSPESGIMHAPWIKDLPLEKFAEEYS